MSDTVQKLRVLARIEIALLKIYLRLLARQTVLCAAGLLAALLAVAMVNVALYLFLAESLVPHAAALIVAVVNGILTVGLFLTAQRSRLGPETAVVEETRDIAVAGLQADVEAVRQNLNQVKADVQRIRSGLGGVFQGGGFLRGLLHAGPLIEVLTKSFRRSKGK